jgi:hypothetical protein
LHHVLEQLAQQNINSVLLESGPKLIGAMVEAGLVDEFKYLERGISYLVFAINNNTQWHTINAIKAHRH